MRSALAAELLVILCRVARMQSMGATAGERLNTGVLILILILVYLRASKIPRPHRCRTRMAGSPRLWFGRSSPCRFLCSGVCDPPAAMEGTILIGDRILVQRV